MVKLEVEAGAVMEFAIGAGAAAAVGMFGTLSGMDRDRAYYAVITVVVATYYLLFAAMAGSAQLLSAEGAGVVLFAALAVVGFRKNLWIVAAALAGHGLFDLVHEGLLDNPGAPAWWPGFCGGFDVTAGGYMAWRLSRFWPGAPLSAQR